MRVAAAVLAGLVTAVACADEAARQDAPGYVAEPSPAASPTTGVPGPDDDVAPGQPGMSLGQDAAIAPGTPAGGYQDWVADLRSGLDRTVRVAGTDREAALHEVRELYASRHEYLQLYFGDGGVLHAGDGLAQAVERSAAEFRSLMRQLASMGGDGAAVGAAVEAARGSLDAIEAEAVAAGLPAAAPRTP
jgi:hypothetical protein